MTSIATPSPLGRRDLGGGPRTRWTDVLAKDLALANITPEEAQGLAQDRSRWREVVHLENLSSLFFITQEGTLNSERLSLARARKRSVGGQKKRFKDTLKSSFKSFKIDTSTWESTAQNRAAWRSHISSGATLYEKTRITEAVRKRASRAAPTSRTPETHLCPTCGRTFRARIGLVSHSRTHKT
ncbi:hypothetical protein Bbelb_229020 [Branchiostoma belcheri]|nr:hypothetical protein Bbelb_229020 [Branchiostoma belcheri]